MQWPSKWVRPSNLIMAISCYSDFSNSLLGAATGTGYWLKLLGWPSLAVGERGRSVCFPESRCNPSPSPPHPTPYTIFPSLLLNSLVINTQTWRIDAQWNKCIVAQTFMSKGRSLQKEKGVKKCEMKTCDLLTALSPPCVTPRMVTRAWRLHWRSNEERAKEER